MSGDDRQQDEMPAPSPLDLPLGGHALADHLLQQAILQQALEENERLRAEVERRARQKQGQPFSSPRFDTAAEAEAYLEQQRKAQPIERKPTAREVLQRYNRAHAQNPKITLKQICEEMNVNYASIRALKSRYTKQRKAKR